MHIQSISMAKFNKPCFGELDDWDDDPKPPKREIVTVDRKEFKKDLFESEERIQKYIKASLIKQDRKYASVLQAFNRNLSESIGNSNKYHFFEVANVIDSQLNSPISNLE